MAMTFWVQSADGDPLGYAMYRRHYSSAKNPTPKQRQFVGPGQSMVLMGYMCNALFVWRKEKFRLDNQTGVNCAVFRNESSARSSEMILEAMSWAWDKWPGERLFTMINAKKTAARRGKRNQPGMSSLQTGKFTWALRKSPEADYGGVRRCTTLAEAKTAAEEIAKNGFGERFIHIRKVVIKCIQNVSVKD